MSMYKNIHKVSECRGGDSCYEFDQNTIGMMDQWSEMQ
jgi:hypothetical protein